jgi:hypothetical protein
MKGNDRTRGAYGIITNKSLKKGDDCRYSYDLSYDSFEQLPSKVKNTFLCSRCSIVKIENQKIHEERQRILEI